MKPFVRYYVANIGDDGVRVIGGGIRGELLTHDEFTERSVSNWVKWKDGQGSTLLIEVTDPYTETLI